MNIKIIGNAPEVERIETGLYSFDRAFENRAGDIGFPLGKATEIFGPNGCGKSTTIYSLSAIIASHKKKNIALADLEGFDPEFLVTVMENNNFSGTVNYIQSEDDEETLDTLIATLSKDSYNIGILDSVGAVSPVSERSGDLGEANMGRRAKLMAQFSRKAIFLLRNNVDKNIFLINHIHPRIGGFGIVTPGGETKNYLLSIRTRVKRKEEFPDGSYVIEGIIIKNRWGYRKRKFYLFMLSGKGLHKGLTAMYDCILLEKAKRSKTIKMGDESFGYLKNIIKKAQAGEDEFFEPFMEALDEIQR